LRCGWLIVPERLIPQLEIVKEASDIGTASFSQRTIDVFLQTGALPQHLQRLRREYQRRRDAMMQALHTHFPANARWYRPRSGFFVWVTLSEEIDVTKLLKLAIEREQIAFVPGHAFCSGGGVKGKHSLRLNFSHCTPQQIDDGIARLGRLLGSVAVRQS
jgi:DNA-binding transcriptional MocR family regulator